MDSDIGPIHIPFGNWNPVNLHQIRHQAQRRGSKAVGKIDIPGKSELKHSAVVGVPVNSRETLNACGEPIARNEMRKKPFQGCHTPCLEKRSPERFVRDSTPQFVCIIRAGAACPHQEQIARLGLPCLHVWKN